MKLNRMLLILGAFAAIAVIGVVAGGGSTFLGNSDEVAVVQTTPDAGSSPAASTAKAVQAAQSTPAPDKPLVAAASVPVSKPGPLLLLNPAVGAPGSAVSVAGSGFDAGATVDVSVKRSESDKGQDIGFAQVDQGGSFGGLNFNIPDGIGGGTFIVIAQQEKSDKRARATGQVQGASPTAKFGTQVGKPGDRLTVSAKGFAPGETVNVYFNTIGSQPVAALQADQGGALGRASLTVPYGPAGNNSFILMGDRSQSPVTVQFLMLNFYPAAGLSSYAAKADTALSFSATGFGPSESVSIYLNSLQSPPVAAVESNGEGAFANAGEYVIPFSLNGKNTFVFVGEKSQAAVTAGFDVLPYTPYAEASTYGARPGTTITFYGRDFARNEVVHVFVGRGQQSAGKEVSCFKTDDRGGISGGGGYTIPHDAQAGKTTFSLVGSKSKAEAPVAFQLMDPGGAVPPSPDEAKEFRCPFEDDQPVNTQPAAGTAAPVPAAPKQQTAPAGTAGSQQPAQASPTPQTRPQARPTPSAQPAR